MKTLLNLMGILAMLSLMGCEKLGFSKGTPACINDRIKEWESIQSEYLDTWQYRYDNKTVYYFRGYMWAYLYDSQCKVICGSRDGFAGYSYGHCPNFHEDRSNAKLIYESDWAKKQRHLQKGH